jgi:hypothetical protein
MRTAVLALMVWLMAACAAGSAGHLPAAPTRLTFDQLADRPLKLPTVAPGTPCPVNSVKLTGGTAPRIGTHVHLGFGAIGPTGNFAWNKTVWELTPATSQANVLLRGGRLDGQGSLFFEGGDAAPAGPQSAAVVDPQGGSAYFFGEMRLPANNGGSFYTYPTSSGCYAIQADSSSFTEVLVFNAI